MKTNTTYPNKTKYTTAQATASCAEFKAGEFVSVEFYFTDKGGIDWYLITKSQSGPLRSKVAYPATALTRFTF